MTEFFVKNPETSFWMFFVLCWTINDMALRICRAMSHRCIDCGKDVFDE